MKATKENPLIWYANCYFDYTAFDYVLEKVSTKYKTSEGIFEPTVSQASPRFQ